MFCKLAFPSLSQPLEKTMSGAVLSWNLMFEHVWQMAEKGFKTFPGWYNTWQRFLFNFRRKECLSQRTMALTDAFKRGEIRRRAVNSLSRMSPEKAGTNSPGFSSTRDVFTFPGKKAILPCHRKLDEIPSQRKFWITRKCELQEEN